MTLYDFFPPILPMAVYAAYLLMKRQTTPQRVIRSGLLIYLILCGLLWLGLLTVPQIAGRVAWLLLVRAVFVMTRKEEVPA